MGDTNSVQDVPPSVMDMLRLFLAASSRGEDVSLVLESRMGTMTTKYRCVGKVAGTPAAPSNPSRQPKMNPARLRRSKLRQEEFIRKKKAQKEESSGDQKLTPFVPNKMDGPQQLVVQLDSQKELKSAEGIPQLDGEDIHAVEKETIEVPSTTTLLSRVQTPE